VLSTIEPEAVVAEAPRRSSRFQIGVTLNLIGAVFNQGSTFVFSIVAANLLGRETFGKYGIVASTLVMLSQISQLACGYTMTKYVAEFRSSDREKTGRVIGALLTIVALVALLASVGLFVGASWLSTSVLKAPELTLGLRIGSGVVFLNVLIGLFMGALGGLEAYRGLSHGLIAYGTIYLIVCSLMTWKFGLNGAFSGLLVSAILGCVLLLKVLVSESRSQNIQIQIAVFPQLRPILLNFAMPAAISGLTYLPAIWIGDAILVRQPDGYSQMALFSAAFALMTAVLFIPNNTCVVGWSILNHHKGLGESEGYRSIFKMNLAVVGAAAVAGALMLALAGPGLLRLFGKDFSGGYTILLIMLGAAIPQALALAILQHLQSQERMWFSFFAVILPRDLLLVGLGYVWIPRSGAFGLAGACGLAWTVSLLAAVGVTSRAGLRTARVLTP
jgi:O-antigen/teichoic acid export membrane protein